MARDPLHWQEPIRFNPDRYIGKPLSSDITQEKMEQLGFQSCPFDHSSFITMDGRKADMTNSAFGTVYHQAYPALIDRYF